MCSSVHVNNNNKNNNNNNNNKKDILILGKGPIQGLDDTKLTAEAQYSINFSRSNRKFCLSLHYNGSNNFFIS